MCDEAAYSQAARTQDIVFYEKYWSIKKKHKLTSINNNYTILD